MWTLVLMSTDFIFHFTICKFCCNPPLFTSSDTAWINIGMKRIGYKWMMQHANEWVLAISCWYINLRMLGCDSKLFKYGNAASCNVGIDFLSAYAWRRVFTWQHNAIKNGPPSLSLLLLLFHSVSYQRRFSTFTELKLSSTLAKFAWIWMGPIIDAVNASVALNSMIFERKYQ